MHGLAVMRGDLSAVAACMHHVVSGTGKNKPIKRRTHRVEAMQSCQCIPRSSFREIAAFTRRTPADRQTARGERSIAPLGAGGAGPDGDDMAATRNNRSNLSVPAGSHTG